MNLKSSRSLLGAAIFVGAFWGISTASMRLPRIELLREVRVTGSSLLLSDLLPKGAGISLRARAKVISLGASPQPGNRRLLERRGVLEDIGASQDVAAEISVPDRIMVSRDARPITVQEVLAAIRNALEHSGISAAANLHPEDILLQTQVLVGPGDVGLEVLRTDFDSGMKRGRFLLWPSRDPKVLPFFVAVRFTGTSHGAALPMGTELTRTRTQNDLLPVSTQRAKVEVLVSPGERATLILHSNALRMIADVIPLERGTMGQQVHVRVVDTGKIFSAQVDGRAHMQVNF
jgi:hypothetical protein